MTDNTVLSTSEANMRDYALWLQAPGGESALPYTVGDLRLLLSPACPVAGVVGTADFVVTPGASAGTVTVSAGVGVTSPVGVTGARIRERYLFGSDGPVDVPVYSNGGTVTRFHRLVAQVIDEQLPMGASSSPWTFRLLEDTGTPPTSNGQNAIGLATVRVAPGQSTGYTITDLRYPTGHVMACKLSGIASGTAAVSNGFRRAMSFSTEVDDPWHMANVTASPTTINIRTDGYYDIFAYCEVSSAASLYLSIALNATGTDNVSLAAAEIPESRSVAASIFTGAWGSTSLTHQQLHAGDTVMACVMGAANATATAQALRVVRREVRP